MFVSRVGNASAKKGEEKKVTVAERGFEIGERVRELRRERALTQDELAGIANVHPITISELERGKRNASARTVKRLAEALGVDVRDLTSGPPPPRYPGGAMTERDFEEGLELEAKRRARREAEKGNDDLGNEP